MTSKERAALRAQANSLEPLFQVGKGGVNDALIAQTLDAFRSASCSSSRFCSKPAPKSPARNRRRNSRQDSVRGRSGRRREPYILQRESGAARAQGKEEKDRDRHEESEPSVCAAKRYTKRSSPRRERPAARRKAERNFRRKGDV